MKEKGFTLVELLAVIVILAVISLIATPMILGVIEKANKSAAIESINGIMDAAEKYMIESMITGNETSRFDFPSDTKLSYKGKKPESGTLLVDEDGNMSITAKINGYCVRKRFMENSLYIINEEACEIESEEIDMSPPSIPTVTVNSTISSIDVTASCSDLEAGVRKIEISMDGGKTYPAYYLNNNLWQMERVLNGVQSVDTGSIKVSNIYENGTLIKKLSFKGIEENFAGPFYSQKSGTLEENKKYKWVIFLKGSEERKLSALGIEKFGSIKSTIIDKEWKKISNEFINGDAQKPFIIYIFPKGYELYMHSLSVIPSDADNSIGTFNYQFNNLNSGTYQIKARCTGFNERTSESEIININL